jgi:hypothetical protein
MSELCAGLDFERSIVGRHKPKPAICCTGRKTPNDVPFGVPRDEWVRRSFDGSGNGMGSTRDLLIIFECFMNQGPHAGGETISPK